MGAGSAGDLRLASMLAAKGGAVAGGGGFGSQLSRPVTAGGGRAAAHGRPEAGAGQGEIQPFGGTSWLRVQHALIAWALRGGFC